MLCTQRGWLDTLVCCRLKEDEWGTAVGNRQNIPAAKDFSGFFRTGLIAYLVFFRAPPISA